jgi:rhamnosyltransferase
VKPLFRESVYSGTVGIKRKDQLPTPPAKANICAVVVTFNPDRQFPERVSKITTQLAHMIIVDNCSETHSRRVLQDMARSKTIELIENEDNRGIAAALNQGTERAKEEGYRWVLTLDQDTIPQDCMVDTLIQVFKMSGDRDKIAIIGSNYYGLMNRPRYQTEGILEGGRL